MAAENAAPPITADGSDDLPRLCHGRARRGPRPQRPAGVARRRRGTITAWLAVVVTGSFALIQLATGPGLVSPDQRLHHQLLSRSLPLLHRFEVGGAAYVHRHRLCGVFAVGWDVGLPTRVLVFLVAAALVVVLVSIDGLTPRQRRLAAVAPGTMFAWVPGPPDTRLAALGHVGSFVSRPSPPAEFGGHSGVVALRDTARAEAVMEAGMTARSHCWPTCCRPASPSGKRRASIIADKCDEASVLFADIVGFAKRASSTAPADLVGSWTASTALSTSWSTSTGTENRKVGEDSLHIVVISAAFAAG